MMPPEDTQPIVVIGLKDESSSDKPIYRGPIKWPKTPSKEESYAECEQLGLLVRDEEGKLVAGPSKAHRVQWGQSEMELLVKEVWPDIPKVGVPFEEVLRRAKEAREATVRIAEMGIR